MRKSATFDTKAQAYAWIEDAERSIAEGREDGLRAPAKATFGDLLAEYVQKVSAGKKGERWESIRIDSLSRDPIAEVGLREIDASHVAAWRDRRLRQVSAGSVLREWNLLSHACNVAVKEWLWLKDNPFSGVKRPAQPKARDRLASDAEIASILNALGYDADAPPRTATARVGAAVIFAIETGMRASEILRLRWSDIAGSVATVRDGKTLAAARRVPLSSRALAVLGRLPRDDARTCFDLPSGTLDTLFRKGKARALVEDLHFHDMRHLAITRLAKKLQILDLARMVGHKDLRMLLIYYNEAAEAMAPKLG
nr:site-specific integrase [Thiomonas sp.]